MKARLLEPVQAAKADRRQPLQAPTLPCLLAMLKLEQVPSAGGRAPMQNDSLPILAQLQWLGYDWVHARGRLFQKLRPRMELPPTRNPKSTPPAVEEQKRRVLSVQSTPQTRGRRRKAVRLYVRYRKCEAQPRGELMAGGPPLSRPPLGTVRRQPHTLVEKVEAMEA